MPSQLSGLIEPAKSRRRGHRGSAVQLVYEGIRELIVDLTLPPGSVISKNDVAAEFGVSQTPVREAFLRLESEGLIDIFPQSKTVVSLIDVQGAREAHFLRLSVEAEIARSLCPVIIASQVAELRDIVARQAAALDANDLSAFTDLDDRFHERIYEFAGVGGLWAVIRGRRAHLDRLRRIHLPSEGKAEAILEEHEAIIDAFSHYDAQAAEQAVRAHLRGTLSASEELRAHFPEYFL